MVTCVGNSCRVTLGGRGATARVLGTTIAFESISDRRATLRVGDRSISCTEGQSVAAGPLHLRCTTVTDATVAFTVSRS